MAGLLLKFSDAPGRRVDAKGAVLIDLAPYFLADHLQRGSLEVAWSHPIASRQWFQLLETDRWLLIEGNPDRFPRTAEPLQHWLEGRWGSFRGFEIRWEGEGSPPSITVFVDPWASRPVYYSCDGGKLVVADKVASLAVNQDSPEVEWAAVLEAMLCGSVYSGGVSLKQATALQPGETVRFSGAIYRDSVRRTIPKDPDISEEFVRSDAAGALRKAMEKSVADVWGSADTRVLLTGGLDSRFILALAGPGRRALHINIYPAEAKLAREIAVAGDCELSELPFPEGQYLRVVERAYLLTGGMFDSRFAWQLGLGAMWNEMGVVGTLNGYLFDTLMKGYFLVPYQKYPYRDSVLFSLFGHLGHAMRAHMSRFSAYAQDMVLDLLTPEAQELGKAQIRRLAEVFPQVIVDGFDVSLEKIVLSNISRQVHYPLLLGWFEETLAYTPTFHPALWSWYSASSVVDRLHGRALRQALASTHHPVCRIPDANTGLKIESLPKPHFFEKLRLRNSFVFSQVRDSLRHGNPKDTEAKRTLVGRDIRLPEGRKFLRDWIDKTREHRLFDRNGIDRAWKLFQAGDDRAGESLLVMIGARQWEEFVRNSDPSTRLEAVPNYYTRVL